MEPLRYAGGQYQALRERIRAQDPDLDEQTLADTLEGLTDLHEIVAAVIRAALADEALAGGLKERLGAMQGRMERLQERAAKRREMARDVLLETGIKKVTAPDFTITVRPGSPALVVVDEQAIPTPYWEPRDPKLNRLALLADLKHGDEIPGCQLSNPIPVLSVRVK